MNKQRRKQLDEIVEALDRLKDQLAELPEQEEARDALPESLQQGERGQRMDESVDSLTGAESALDEAIEHIRSATASP
ncbi:conserved hypothetical protein [Xanthomonas citri pv. citri]|nr:conserved hypothetical protein [Xanthomonas citri pv. citri]